MDNKIIKNQISYWEAQAKENDRQVKTLVEQGKVIKATIKNLKGLLTNAPDELASTFSSSRPEVHTLEESES